MFGLLVVALIQKPIALPSHAMRLDALMKELSTQTGQTYKAGAPMVGRIVFVGGPARPIGDLRTDLAAATYGKWRRVADDWLLDEDKEAVIARERARLASRVAQVQAQQAAMRAEGSKPFDEAAAKELLATLGKFDEAEKRDPTKSYPFRQKVEAGVPANNALRRIVANLDPMDLAALEIGSLVYSDRPTRLQRPLPPAAVNAIRQVERDQAVWARIYPDNTEFLASHQSRMSMDPRNYTEPMAAGSLRLVLKATAFEHGQTLFSGNFVDKLGHVRQFGDVSIDFRDGRDRQDSAPKFLAKEPKLVLSSAAMAYSDTRQGKPAAPELRPIVLYPERREPLDLLIGEGLQGIARARNAGIVAWLGDDAMNFTVWKGESASEWLRDLYQMNYEVRESPGSILIRPRFTPENVARTPLGAILRLADGKGYVPFDDLAEYAAATPTKNSSGDTLSRVMLSIIVPGLLEASRADWKLLALWGGFTRAQRQALLAPGNIPWANIPKSQRDRLTGEVLNAESNEIEQRGSFSPFITLEREPTEILANGFTFGDGVMGSSGFEEGVFAASDSQHPYEGGMASAWSLANAMATREKSPNEQHFDGLPKRLPDAYVYGRIINFGLRIQLSPTITYRKSGRFGEFDMRSRPQPIDAMPEAFRNKFNKALEQDRKRMTGG